MNTREILSFLHQLFIIYQAIFSFDERMQVFYLIFSDSPRVFHLTSHRKEEEHPFWTRALIGWSRTLASSRTVAKQWAGKSHVDEVDGSLRYFLPGNWRIVFILSTTKRLFGRSAWQQPCHRRPKRKPRPELVTFLLVMSMSYSLCCCCFSVGKRSQSLN